MTDNLVTVPLITRYARSTILRTVHSVTVEPFHEIRLPVRIKPAYSLRPSNIEPLPTRYSTSVAVAKVYVEPKIRITICQMANVSNKPITIHARTAIATISPADLLSHSTTDNVRNQSQYDACVTSVDTSDVVGHAQKRRTLRNAGFRLEDTDLNPDQFVELVDLLYTYRGAFAQDVKGLPCVKDVQYNITLQPGARPKRQRQYRYPPHMREVIREQPSEWEQAGIIAEGDPTWIHPIVLVRKKALDNDRNAPPRYRACLDIGPLIKSWLWRHTLCQHLILSSIHLGMNHQLYTVAWMHSVDFYNCGQVTSHPSC